MIILGTIQRVEKQVLTDRQDSSKKSEMWQLIFTDSTKPVQFRMTTPLIMFLGPDRLLSAMGTRNPDDLADEPVTLAVSELSAYNAFLKIKGQLVKGHVTGQALAELQATATSEALNGKPAEPAKPEPKGDKK